MNGLSNLPPGVSDSDPYFNGPDTVYPPNCCQACGGALEDVGTDEKCEECHREESYCECPPRDPDAEWGDYGEYLAEQAAEASARL